MTATKEQFFKPGKRGSKKKSGVSEHKAMQIAASEAAERAKKTEHLRKLRLASLADQKAATTLSLTAKPE